MQIFIRTPYDNTIVMEIKNSYTIRDIKEKIYSLHKKYPVNKQRLLLDDLILMNNILVCVYKIKDQTTLDLVFCYNNCF